MTEAEKPKLIPASENPWYLLATVHGEQSTGEFSIDWELHARNRKTWNAWISEFVSKEERQNLHDAKWPYVDELTELTDADRIAIANRFDALAISPPKLETFLVLRKTEFPNNTIFSGLLFQGVAAFSEAAFQGTADFSEAAFQGNAYFIKAAFQGGADFSEAAFQRNATFGEAAFQGDAYFGETAFQRNAYFSEAAFQGDADFSEAAFQGYTIFSKAAFQGGADFSEAAFQRNAYFSEAAFQGDADFSEAVFQRNANFRGRPKPGYKSDSVRGREFEGVCQFANVTFGKGVVFTNRVFLGETDFENCRFLRDAPVFDGAELHEGTTWHGITWAPVPEHTGAARKQANAYRRLRLEMNTLQDHDQELEFLALEMMAKRGADGGAKGFLITLYQISCDFGRSVSVPVLWLLGLWLGTAPVYQLGLHYLSKPLMSLGQSYGFSLASMGGLFGMRREFFGPLMGSLPDGLLVLSGVQSVLGAVFVFLLGLCLRNRFRIR